MYFGACSRFGRRLVLVPTMGYPPEDRDDRDDRVERLSRAWLAIVVVSASPSTRIGRTRVESPGLVVGGATPWLHCW